MAGVRSIFDVELLEVGEDWQASTGPVTITEQHLISAIAADDDSAVRSPVIKLGHRLVLNDGEPAFGRITNLHLSIDGRVLLGDLVGVPDWLAAAMPSMYPRRSIEGTFGLRTQTGAEHDFVLTACALLGAAYPAITTLEDIRLLATAESTDDITFIAAAAATDETVPGTEKGPEMALKTKQSKAIELAVNDRDVRRAYYDQLDAGNDSWLWIVEMQFSPDQLIVVDDRDESYVRVPFSVDGDDLTFEQPVAVRKVYEDATTEVAATQARPSIVFATKQESRAANDGSNESQPSSGASMTPEQLKKIGLGADASQEEIDARLSELVTASTTESEGEGSGECEGDEGKTAPGSPPVVVPQQKDAPVETPPTVTVDAAAWDANQAAVARMQKALDEQEARDKDLYIAAAMTEGKFGPAVRDQWRKALDGPGGEAVKATIAAMPAGAVPVIEAGHAGSGEDAASDDAYR